MNRNDDDDDDDDDDGGGGGVGVDADKSHDKVMTWETCCCCCLILQPKIYWTRWWIWKINSSKFRPCVTAGNVIHVDLMWSTVVWWCSWWRWRHDVTTAAAGGAGPKSDGSVNNESAQLMMSVLDRQRTGKDYTSQSVKNDLDASWRSHGSASEPTYADIMTSSSLTRRSDDNIPVFPRHQLQVLGLLGIYVLSCDPCVLIGKR